MILKLEFPKYKISRQGDLAPRTSVALAYIHISALHIDVIIFVVVFVT
jgi:hypothetical protein